MKTISVNVPETFVKGLEELVKKDMYANRSEAIRVSIRDLLKRELYDNTVVIVKEKQLPFVCDICSAEFPIFSPYIEHLRKEHPQVNTERLIADFRKGQDTKRIKEAIITI